MRTPGLQERALPQTPGSPASVCCSLGERIPDPDGCAPTRIPSPDARTIAAAHDAQCLRRSADIKLCRGWAGMERPDPQPCKLSVTLNRLRGQLAGSGRCQWHKVQKNPPRFLSPTPTGKKAVPRLRVCEAWLRVGVWCAAGPARALSPADNVFSKYLCRGWPGES